MDKIKSLIENQIKASENLLKQYNLEIEGLIKKELWGYIIEIRYKCETENKIICILTKLLQEIESDMWKKGEK